MKRCGRITGALALIGMGVGYLFDRMLAGLFIGIGLGMLLDAFLLCPGERGRA